MVNMNGVALRNMTYNETQVKTWTHDGVLVYQSATPWKPYELEDVEMVANSPAAVPYSTLSVTPVPSLYFYQAFTAPNASGSISTNNVNGTRFLPTKGCSKLDIVLASDAYHINIAEVFALVNGVETLIHTKNIPKRDDNTDNYIDGVEVNKYVHNWTNIDVSGYELVKVVHRGTGSASRGASLGIGVASFHN